MTLRPDLQRTLDERLVHTLRKLDEEVKRGALHNVPPYDQSRAKRALMKALELDATQPLSYIGSGVTGTVIGDASGLAFKVAHNKTSQILPEEAKWLELASQVLGDRVAQFIAFCPKYDMRPRGWSQPECKPDSFVWTNDRGPVLVDAGFAVRLGG